MKRPPAGYVYLGLTILLWSSTPAVSKVALAELDRFQLLFYTSFVGTLSLLLVNFLQGKLSLLTHYSRKDFARMIAMGFLGLFGYYSLLYSAFSLAPAGQVNVINYLWPIFIVIFSHFILGESLRARSGAAILVSFFGALLAFSQGKFSNFTHQYAPAYSFALAAAVCYGLFSVLGKKFHYDKFSSMLVYFGTALLFVLPMTLIASSFKVPEKTETIISILVLGGLNSALGFVFWFKALSIGNTQRMANLIYSVPFLAMIWTYFLNNEPFSAASILGLCLIVTGIFIQLTGKTK